MTNPPPTLDRRRYQDILQQLLVAANAQFANVTPSGASIPWRYARPEFLDALQRGEKLVPPYDDIGLMIAGIYARLMELTLERFNEVPAKNRMAFLDTMGVSLLPPMPARAPLTFELAQGAAPTLIPLGTRVATQASVLFSTEQEMMALPATITRSVTVDPVWDRFTEQTPLLGDPTSNGLIPWVGVERMPHILYIGGGEVFQFMRDTTLTLMQPGASGQIATSLSSPLQTLLKGLTWQYSNSKESEGWTDFSFDTNLSHLFTPDDQIDSLSIQGVGLESGIQDRWLRAILPTAIEDATTLYDSNGNLLPMGLVVALKADSILPQAAFTNSAAVDLSRPFLLFGEVPATGDVFMLGSDVFGYTNAKITLSITLATGTPVNTTLIWEYWGPLGWQPFDTAANLKDNTQGMKGPATVSCTIGNMPVAVPTSINNLETCWIRVRIVKGNYGELASYTTVSTTSSSNTTPTYKAATLDAPLVTSLLLSYELQVLPTVATQNGFLYADQTSVNKQRSLVPFISVSAIDRPAYSDLTPSFYLGFDTCYPQLSATLYFAVRPRALSGSVNRHTPAPPAANMPLAMTWEYYNGRRWSELAVIDQTSHLTEAGVISFLTPPDMAMLARFDLTPRAWIRARVPQVSPMDTPVLSGIFLNTVEAVQSVTFTDEILGSGSGLPGQSLTVTNLPVQPGEMVMVIEAECPPDMERKQLEEEQALYRPKHLVSDIVQERVDSNSQAREIRVEWQPVSNFLASTERSRHYTLDRITGKVTFGDGTRGMIPPSGTDNILITYQAGGGAAGNTTVGTITQLFDTLSGVTGASNPLDADGGAEIETSAMVVERGPQMLRRRGQAISPADLEWLAREAAGTWIARARCLPNIGPSLCFEPGWVTLILVPQAITSRPQPSATLLRQVEEYLLQRVPLLLGDSANSRINLVGPGYLSVFVIADIVPVDIYQAQQVRDAASKALDQFLNPVTGGRDGTGWEFGRGVYESEIAHLLQSVSGIKYVKSLQLRSSSAQYVCTFDPQDKIWLKASVSVETVVRSADGRKSALLAEPLSAGSPTDMMLKGFKEGDRITVALDAVITNIDPNKNQLTISVKSFSDPPTKPMTFPRCSPVIRADGAVRTTLKSGLYVPAVKSASGGTLYTFSVESVASFQVGDAISLLYPFPMIVRGVRTETTQLTVSGNTTSSQVTVAPFETDILGLPETTRIRKRATRFDSTRIARIGQAIPSLQSGNTLLILEGENKTLVDTLVPGDLLDVRIPMLALDILPYRPDVTLPEGYVLTTLDNRVRLPLASDLKANQTAEIVSMLDFEDAEPLTLAETGDMLKSGFIDSQESVVYMDANYLACSGTHALTMVSE